MVPRRHPGLLLALAALGSALPAHAVEVNRIVLRVNEHIVTQFDYEARRDERIRALSASQLPPEQKQAALASAGVATLRTLFEELLLLSRAEQLGIEATPAEVEDSIQRTKESFGIQTEEEFDRALAQSDLTRQELREQTARSITMQKVIGREIRPRIEVSEEDLRRYYQAHAEEFAEPARLELREIVLLEASGAGSTDLMRLARELRERIAAGETVDQEIEDYRNRGLATSWIELGWVAAGDLDADLERAVWELPAGEVSEPVPGRGGLHLLQVLERQEARQLAFSEVQERIQNIEADRVFGDEMERYLSELEEASHIVSRPPPEAAEFRASVPRTLNDPMSRLDRSLAGAAATATPAEPAPPAEGEAGPPDDPGGG